MKPNPNWNKDFVPVLFHDVWRQHPGLLAITTAFLTFALVYCVSTPVFEASDEIWHYPFVKSIADGKGLPIQKPRAEDNVARQEGSQPPLYYALAALVTFWIDTGDFNWQEWMNPHAKVGIPLAYGNKNIAVHTDQENFPYHGPALAVHLIRWLSIGMGLVTVISTYLLARELVPSSKALAVGAAAVTALNPQFLFISASINNDNLVSALSALAILQMVRIAKNRQTSSLRFFGLGVLIGLGLLSKLTAVGLIPLAALVAAVAAYRVRSVGLFARAAILTGAPALAIAGWWYVRNWILYGEPLGVSMMLKIVGERVPQPGLLELMGEFEGFKISFWGLFGAVNVISDKWVYHVFDSLVVLSIVGLGVMAARKWATKKELIQIHYFIPLLWLGIVVTLFVRWTQTTMASQGRLIFPAIPVISLLIFGGLSSFVPTKRLATASAILTAGMAAIAIFIPFGYIRPAYPGPQYITLDLAYQAQHKAGISYAGQVELIGYSLDKDEARPGETLELTLYWRALADMDKDYSMFIHLVGREGKSVGQEDSFPGSGAFPTHLWRRGDVTKDVYRIPVSPLAAAPTALKVKVGLYDLITMERLQPSDSNGIKLESAPTLSVIRLKPGQASSLPSTLMKGVFGGQIGLVDFAVGTQVVKPGQAVDLALSWTAAANPSKDYTVFTQMIGPDGRVWAQHDKQPLSGDYPTSMWKSGDIVADNYSLRLEPGAPVGAYTLITGLYSLDSGIRLARTEGVAEPDSFVIARIMVTP